MAASALRIGLEVGVLAAVWGAVTAWERANRVALDLDAWCGCGQRALTVRVIASRPAQPARAGDTEARGARVDDSATLVV